MTTRYEHSEFETHVSVSSARWTAAIIGVFTFLVGCALTMMLTSYAMREACGGAL